MFDSDNEYKNPQTPIGDVVLIPQTSMRIHSSFSASVCSLCSVSTPHLLQDENSFDIHHIKPQSHSSNLKQLKGKDTRGHARKWIALSSWGTATMNECLLNISVFNHIGLDQLLFQSEIVQCLPLPISIGWWNFILIKLNMVRLKKLNKPYKGCLENCIMTSPANIYVSSKMKLLS